MPRNVNPEEMRAIAQLASENPDLRAVVVELGQLRALRTAQAPLRPASFRELLKGVELGVLSASEGHSLLGLPRRRGTLERLLTWSVWPLPVVPSEGESHPQRWKWAA